MDTIGWLEDESVLGVGTGLGLLMIGAAKKLTTGKSYGIDILILMTYLTLQLKKRK